MPKTDIEINLPELEFKARKRRTVKGERENLEEQERIVKGERENLGLIFFPNLFNFFFLLVFSFVFSANKLST
jgi:hypothetical protein